MIIVLNPSDRETSLCANSKQIVSTVVAFYGDEISRQRFRRFELVSLWFFYGICSYGYLYVFKYIQGVVIALFVCTLVCCIFCIGL